MKKDVKIKLPEEVEFIINEICKHKGTAYAVGGCIRDSIMDKKPNDWDIATNLKPEEVKVVFEGHKIIDKGIDFGTIALYVNDGEFEITTFRIDAGSKDCRHPETVTFSSSLEEDLSRRDFTINAMAYNPEVGLIDIYNGYEDIQSKNIRAVGDPNERFTEDALRMMRAIRLSAQHGFTVEKETYNAIKTNSKLIRHISQERFNKELIKTIESDNPDYIEHFYKTGIADVMFPELTEIFECEQDNPNHFRGNRPTTVGEHTMDVLKASVVLGKEDSIYNSLDVRVALLVHDFGKPSTKSRRLKKEYGEIDSFFGHPDVSAKIAERCLRRLKFPNAIIGDVCKLTKYHDTDFAIIKSGEIRPNGSQLRKAYADFGGTRKISIDSANILMEKLFAVRICDCSGQNSDVFENFKMMSASEKVAQIEVVRNILKDEPNILNVLLPINGESVRKAIRMNEKGMKVYGKFIGDVLNKMQARVIKNNTFLARLEDESSENTIYNYAKSMGLDNIVSDEFFEAF